MPRQWRPEATITADILAAEPDLIKDIELQGIVTEYLRDKPEDEEIIEDPIAKAGEQARAKAGSRSDVKFGVRQQASKEKKPE